MKVAKKEKKMVFIDFYTDWCGPCKKMSRDVFPQERVGNFFNANFVCLKMNAEREGKEYADLYKVQAYPTFIVLDTKGEVVMDVKGAMDADTFVQKVKSGINPDNSPKRLEERYLGGERTPDLVNTYAMSLMEQKREEDGFNVINNYFDALSDKERVSAPNAFIYLRYTLKLDDPKAKFMVFHRDEFGQEVLPEIKERIQRLYRQEVTTYLSGYQMRENKYKEEEYQALKQEIISLGLDKDYEYAPIFELIESRVKNDDATFMADCNRLYGSLNANDQLLLLMNITRLVQTEDKEVIGSIVTFIRSRLSDMSPMSLSVSARILDSLEGKLNK
jgi:thiol-disulfide isomerase/thioredoxin